MEKVTPRVLIEDARQKLSQREQITGQSARRFDEISERFALFALRGFGVDALNDITLEVIEAFVRAKAEGRSPSNATMHLRRSTIRLLFRIAYEQFGLDDDRTPYLDLPPRSSLPTRPLTDDEVAIGRSFALATVQATRQPAAWALGEATATTSELPYIVTDDLDLDNARIWLHGSRKREPRWGQLSDWGVTQLARRAKSLQDTSHLIYQADGSEESAQRSCCEAIKETLVRSGLGAEPDVRPGSLPAWAGRAIFEESRRIEYTALRLGIRSLDTCAHFIGLDWRAES